MAKRELRSKAIEMRLKGMSYSQIRQQLSVSKSSLSTWLRDYPLPQERLRELRDHSESRIERCRETKARKRAKRLQGVSNRVMEELGTLSDRELLLCGLFLYWGEGGKTQPCTVSISNTDPNVIIFFKKWLNLVGVPDTKLRIRIQIYADMDAQAESCYWLSVLQLPPECLRKPYVKCSNQTNLTYARKFMHGTCNLSYDNRDTAEYVLAALDYLRTSVAVGSQL